MLFSALNHDSLRDSKACSYVLAALNHHQYDVTIQSGGLLALSHLLKTGLCYTICVYVFVCACVCVHAMIIAYGTVDFKSWR